MPLPQNLKVLPVQRIIIFLLLWRRTRSGKSFPWAQHSAGLMQSLGSQDSVDSFTYALCKKLLQDAPHPKQQHTPLTPLPNPQVHTHILSFPSLQHRRPGHEDIKNNLTCSFSTHQMPSPLPRAACLPLPATLPTCPCSRDETDLNWKQRFLHRLAAAAARKQRAQRVLTPADFIRGLWEMDLLQEHKATRRMHCRLFFTLSKVQSNLPRAAGRSWN